MKKIFYNLSLSILVAFFCSCSFNQKSSAWVFFQKNSLLGSDVKDIENFYGKPQLVWKSGKQKFFSYNFSKVSYQLSAFFPFPLFHSEFKNYEIIMVFEQDKLTEMTKFSDRMKTKSWLLCESSIADCNVSYEIVDRN